MLATSLDTDDPVSITCEEGPFAAQVFKTVVDPFVGKLNVMKVFRGTLKSGTTVYNATTGKTERINQIYLLRGKKQEPVSELSAGDIGAVNKLAATNTGDTLCDENVKVKFDPIHFPRPVLSMAIYAEKKGEEDKIFQGLNKLAEEDYTFTVTKNKETGEMLINGQGETHLDVINRKLKAKFNVSALLKTPKIAYRETIRKTVEAEGKHKKQSGGHGQYGHCKVRFEPFEGEFEFAEEVVGGSVPKQYIPAVEKGLIECLPHGVLAGYPVTGLRAVLYDGSYHDVDSSEMAFKLAAALAFKEGLKNAKPVLLEPVMKLKIAIPENFLGDIMGDMNKRRGRILGIDMMEGMQVVNAEAPQAEIQRYATDLRSMTQGRGKFTAELARYEEVPAGEAEKIVKARQAEKRINLTGKKRLSAREGAFFVLCGKAFREGRLSFVSSRIFCRRSFCLAFAAERGGHAFAAEAAAFPLSDDEEDDQQHDDAGDAEQARDEPRPPGEGDRHAGDEVQ